MYHPFVWDLSKNRFRRAKDRTEWLWAVGLLLAAVLLFGINLGGLPLRDWDEGTVAQVAREIWRAPAGSWHWLYPTLLGEPYLNKPPVMHLLIAWAYCVGGVNEWTSRLPGAMLTAFSVPLLYALGREIFPQRQSAVFSALVYLTMLPVVRHGRLAMLDGAVLCFFLFMMWCLLRSRRDLRYCLGVGIGLGLICLTKGILGLLLGAIALLFLLWDTPRLLTSGYLWSGILIGSTPAALWYLAQWVHYGNTFTDQAMMHQSWSRVWTSVENHKGPPWYYLLEVLKYAWPWLLFLPPGFDLTWENRNLSWAKLLLTWSGAYLLAISIMGTKLPWYILPVYPAFSLAVGFQLSEVWNWPSLPCYPRPLVVLLALLAVLSWVGSLCFSPWIGKDWDVMLILLAVAGTMTLAAVLAARGDRQSLIVLFWGTYVSLLLLMISHHWVWELAEAYPVKPVAAMVQHDTVSGQTVYTSYPYSRPALDFYSDRHVIPADSSELLQHWQQDTHPYFLLDRSTLEHLKLESVKLLSTDGGWMLVTKET